jgi:hypothetical protein
MSKLFSDKINYNKIYNKLKNLMFLFTRWVSMYLYYWENRIISQKINNRCSFRVHERNKGCSSVTPAPVAAAAARA